MKSIATRRGDDGSTGLGGGSRTSKADARVEAYGSIDELNAAIGLARAFCDDAEVAALARAIQRDLFAIGSAVSTKPGSRREIPVIGDAFVQRLDDAVARLEAEPGILRDWSISGEDRRSAAFDLARTVARRAERNVVRFVTAGEPIQVNVLKYLNRLSDVLWLCARKVEARIGVDARLRDEAHPGPPWSRAW
ncbi:MAG: ATP/cobalamin adenosyltransferase [Candidatus Eremiobacteraeota bacterium]|nr:ATP/cobalamin adenosyltransferase [Candidatus Eremiobacteraeota bacterium]